MFIKDALSERNATENLDNPEGLMDGLMQVAVCQDVSFIVACFVYIVRLIANLVSWSVGHTVEDGS